MEVVLFNGRTPKNSCTCLALAEIADWLEREGITT